VFREIDIQRERDALDAWRAAGNRGRPPPPLMQFDELPDCYQTEEPFEVKEVDEALEGRGQRRRNVVSYTDGLSDDAWAMVCYMLPCPCFVFFRTFHVLGTGRGRGHSRTFRATARKEHQTTQ
jgi:hypothetical protein